MNLKIKHFLPLIALAALVLVLYYGLYRDPRLLPSALLNKPVPAFSEPDLIQGDYLVTRQDLLGHVTLVNVWATWCTTCWAEHHALLDLASQQRIHMIGINYKDDPVKARAWLEQYGNPYQHIAVDAKGELGMNLGVYGTPETYIVDKKGVIRYKRVGVVDSTVWQEQLLPVIERLEKQ